MSVHSTGVLQSVPPVDNGPVRADSSIYPRSAQGSGRGKVVADPLLGQVNYTVPITGTPMYVRHVVPTDASVQGPCFTAIPPRSISYPVAVRPITVVCQDATLLRMPPQVTTLTPGVFTPQSDGMNTMSSCNYGVLPSSAVPFSSRVPFGSAVESHTAIPTGSAVPLGTGILPNPAVMPVTPRLVIPTTPAVPPMPPEFQTSPVPSTVFCNAVPQPAQPVMRSYVPTTAGYMRLWVWSASGSVPAGSVPVCEWIHGVSVPVGMQVATGRVAGLPEQARGTASVVPNQNPLANPTVSSVAVQNAISSAAGISGSPVLQSNNSVSATGSYTSPSVVSTGVSGWPETVTPTVGPPGAVGGVMGLPEQARGTAQTIVMGIAGPSVRPPQPPNAVIT